MKKILPILLLCAVSCELDTQHLTGRWRAIALYEGGQTVTAPLDSVLLHFSENGNYKFGTIGFYREEGPFRVAGKHLFLTDTTEKTPKEHILEVLFLSNDTLKLRMEKDGNEQVMFLTKMN